MGFLTDITDALGLTDSGADSRALERQTAAMEEANKLQREMYEENVQRLSPYAEAGGKGFSQLVDMTNNYQDFRNADGPFKGHSGVFTMADFRKDPAYEFRMREGQKAIDRSAAARGMRHSGATLKSLARFGQDLGSQEYDKAYNRFNQDYGNAYNRFNQEQGNRFNRVGNIANIGLSANQSMNSAGTNFGNQMAQNAISLGNAQANYEMNKGNTMKDLWQMGTSAVMACWVARAVFGKESPKWLQARNYIMNIGPEWFKKLYLAHGEKFAKKVEKSKTLKIIIRPLFEYFAWRGKQSLKLKPCEVAHA